MLIIQSMMKHFTECNLAIGLFIQQVFSYILKYFSFINNILFQNTVLGKVLSTKILNSTWEKIKDVSKHRLLWLFNSRFIKYLFFKSFHIKGIWLDQHSKQTALYPIQYLSLIMYLNCII